MHKAILALDRVKARLDAVERQKHEPIAVIGMACRFPGDASSPEAFIRLLESGFDAVTQVPDDRWRLPSMDEADLAMEGRATRWGGFLRQPIDSFDAAFFGISPREAAHLDPQQRLLLEVAWEALERAGHDPSRLVGSATGVFVGISTNDYIDLCKAAGPEGEDLYTATGNGHSFAPGRLSYTFGFHGPSVAVDTACSSSLVAIHLACQSLRSGEATLALAGGVNLMLTPDTTRLIATTQALSPDGWCKTFDAAANGFVRGEGCGIVVLKRLSEAERDGDTILALIRGSAVNQDGRSTGLTTPNVRSQQSMLQQAAASARVSPADIGYVETHGTGTSLGDPIEFEALRAVVGKPRSDGSSCVLGAVKTNIGHLEAAAGVAGLIKAVMVLNGETIPKNLHFRTLNPRIALEGTPFVVPTENVPWPRGERPRLAGVSSFGLSGTNAHVIIEEPRPEWHERHAAPPSPAYLLPISAKTPDALRALLGSYAALLASSDAPPLGDIAYTASARRAHHENRVAIVARTREEACEGLEAYLRGRSHTSVFHGRSPGSARPKVVFVFPGQGSQWIGMGRQLLASQPAFRDAVEICDEAVRRIGGFSIVEELQADEGRSRLADIGVLQPVLFAIEVALATLWRAWGIEPDAVLGHSMGEVAAARIAGILSLDDAVKVICRRSRLLRKVAGRGAMALIELTVEGAREAIAGYEDRISIAVSNGPRSTVLSGDPEALDEVLSQLERASVFCRRVKVDVASHSPQMDPLREELLVALRNVRPRPARLAMRSTVTGDAVRGVELDAAYWVKNLREPVMFSTATQRLIEDGHTLFVEISPHPILLPSVVENFVETGREGGAVASLRRGTSEHESLLEGLATLYVRGYPVDWKLLHPAGGQSVALPTYPWQRERFWVERGTAIDRPPPTLRRPYARLESAPAQDARASWLWEITYRRKDLRPDGAPTSARDAWLVLSDSAGTGDALAAALRARGRHCVLARTGRGMARHDDGSWEIDPADPEAYRALLREAFASGAPCSGVVHLFGVDAREPRPTSAGEVERAQRLTVESALLLAQAALRVESHAPPRLFYVSSGALALPGDAAVSSAQAPLWGFGRSLQTEHPELGCTVIDLAHAHPVGEVDALLAELLGNDGEDQIALRGGERFVARLAQRAWPEQKRAPLDFSGEASYLVTGGLGGLGLSAAAWLVERGARRVVLAGRSAPSEAAARAIAQMEAAGAKVLVVSADVSRAEDVNALIARAEAELGPLRGVLHAAGVLADRTVLELSVDAVRAVAAPKILGAWNLHAATRDRTLDFFVLYASGASLFGPAGQSNYAAANAFVDALAHERQLLGLPALTIDWGPFSEVGLAAAQANRGERLATMGLQSITPQEGNDVLASLMRASIAQVGVMPLDVDRAAAAMPRLATAAYFQELVRRPDRPRAAAAPRLDVDGLRRAPAGERRARLEAVVRDELARVLRTDTAKIDPGEPFYAYGFDSLMGLELRNRIQTALSVALTVGDILAHPRVEALTALLDERLGPPAGEPVPRPLTDTMPLPVIPKVGTWVVIPRSTPSAKLRLFCFAYAGGAAPVFASWPSGLPAEVEVCAVQLPGRYERLHEAMPDGIEGLVSAIVPALLPYLDRPFATFGHCLGAILMFEVLRALAAKHGKSPVHVFASGAPAPPRYLVPSVATTRGSEDFTELLRFIGFARDDVLADRDSIRELLPAVKADFEVAARYVYTPAPPLPAPITSFAGKEDPFAPPETVEQWGRQTSAWSQHVVLEGEHYFIVPEREAVLRVIGEELMFRLGAVEARATGSWTVPLPPRTRPRARLFCFAGLGGDSSLFARWASALGDDVEVVAVERPGRGLRKDELPVGRVDELLEHLAAVIRPATDATNVFVGADLGALLAFEVARRLRRESAIGPSRLLVVSAMAPQLHYFAPMHRFPTARLAGALALQGVHVDRTPHGVRALRAECAALASYAFMPEPPLDVPITAVIGARDAFVPASAMRGWSAMTSAGFDLSTCAGTHELLREESPELLDIVRAALSRSAAL